MQDFRKQNPQSGKKDIFKRVLCAFLILILIALAFLGCYGVRYYTEDPASRTLRWVKSMVRQYYYREIPRETLSAATLDDLFGFNGKEALLDRYSDYYTAESYKAYQAQQAGSRSDIGLSFISMPDGAVQIYRVTGNSPAEESGLRAGMYVLGYGAEGENTVYDGIDGFLEYLDQRADGEPFVLSVSETQEGDGAYYTLYKSAYTQNYVFYADAELLYRFTGERAATLTVGATPFSYLPDDTAYIRLDSFAGNAAAQFEGMLSTFKIRGKKRLVFDLRNNGGGQMSVLCDIASFLCKNAVGKTFPVSTVRYKNGKEESFKADENRYGNYFSSESEIFVLANANTASASEALMGAMLDYGSIGYGDIFLAEIGPVARSYGKGIMQTTYFNFLTGEGVKLTSATVHWPVSGNCIQERGILPADGAISLPARGYADCDDVMLRTMVSNYLV